MIKKSLMRFLKPDRRKVILVVLLFIVAWGGQTQAWVFNDKDMGIPKPFLFDQIAFIPFWYSSVILFAPLFFADVIISSIYGYEAEFFFRTPFWSLAISIVYIYVLSCVIIASWDFLTKKVLT